jgi:tetratricopeptide (TPR) repeat protein
MVSCKHLLVFFLVLYSVGSSAQFRLYEKGHDAYKAANYGESVKYLTEYLTKSTRDKAIDIDVFYIRALAHFKSNKFQEAIPDFEETLLRGHENKGNIYWFMAKCYDKLNQNEGAINAYNNAIRELGSNGATKAKLLYERSLIFSKNQNILEAYNDLREGKLADAGNTDIQKRLEQLERENVALLRQAENKKSQVSKTEAPSKSNTPSSSTGTEKTNAATIAVADAGGKKDSKKDEPVVSNKQKSSTPPPATVKPEEKAVVTTTSSEPVTVANTLADLYKDEKRYALVIGNSTYPKTIGVLRNPKNDATDMAEELKKSNFEVTLLTDATYGQIRAALMRFKENLDGGDREKTVGLFYYAGHGLQFDDENYLVPIDASVEYEDDIPRYCFPINRMVLANMERASTRMNIVILDACRNNPFPSLNRSLGNAGLGEMKRARGSFIAYATAPGSVASDGTGRNGLYTQELLKSMKKPGLTIEQVFKEVRMNVLKQSGNKQNTWDSSNIIGEFHFRY